jgi:hypothetical protein
VVWFVYIRRRIDSAFISRAGCCGGKESMAENVTVHDFELCGRIFGGAGDANQCYRSTALAMRLDRGG